MFIMSKCVVTSVPVVEPAPVPMIVEEAVPDTGELNSHQSSAIS
jgi:hypothetical protein